MKILIVTTYMSPIYGGITKVVEETLEALGKQKEITVDLLTTNAKLESDPNCPVNTWIQEEGYRVRYHKCIYRDDLIFSFSLLRYLWNHVEEYDIVHIHTIFSPLISVACNICQIKGMPYVITPHGILEPWSLNYKKGKKEIYYKLLDKNNLKKASALQAIASVEKSNLHSLDVNKELFYVPNGLNAEEFSSLPSADIFTEKFPETKGKTLILFLGRMNPKKGLDLLAPAFAKVKQKYPQLHLVVAGPDKIGFLPTVKKYFQQSNCIEDVTFTGMLTGEIKYAALSAAQIYIAPSYSEGFSMSILEGMASNCACVITTGCNFPEAKEANVAKVVDISVDNIVQSLLWCLDNPQESQNMAIEARKFILNNYTWQEIAKKLIDAYQKILVA